MAVIKTLAINLVARTAAFERNMKDQKKTVREFKRAVGDLDRAIVGLAAVTAVSGAAMIKLGSIASETQEIMSKFDTVFAELSDSARRWSEDFSNDVGRATRDVANSMATLQDTFVPLGFARDTAFELSKSLVQLATDVASFNNKADADVLRDFTSALVGSQETVRKYGIILSVATLEQEALRRGMTKSFKEFTELEKVALRYSVILRSTSDAQGDAIRTGDSYANQVKKMQAAVTNLSSTLGTELLPAMTETVLNITNFVKLLSANDAELGKNILKVAAYSAAFFALNRVVKIVTTSFKAVTSAIKVMTATSATAQAVAGGPAAWIKLAAGISVATASLVSVNKLFKETEKTIGDVTAKQDEFYDVSLKGLGGGASDETTKPFLEEINKIHDGLWQTRQQLNGLKSFGRENLFEDEIKVFDKLTERLKNADIAMNRLRNTIKRIKENARQEKLFESLSGGVEEFNAKLREQIELFGLTSNEQTIEKLRRAGEELKGFNKITFGNLIMDSEKLLAVLRRMEDQANKTNKAIELTSAQKAEMTRLERIKDFADSVKQSLKSNMVLLKEFKIDLREAVEARELSTSQAAEALRRKALELFPMDDVVGGGAAGGASGRSEAIRTSLVSVAGLSGGANPQVRAQQETNNILKDQTRILREIEQKEGLG